MSLAAAWAASAAGEDACAGSVEAADPEGVCAAVADGVAAVAELGEDVADPELSPAAPVEEPSVAEAATLSDPPPADAAPDDAPEDGDDADDADADAGAPSLRRAAKSP